MKVALLQIEGSDLVADATLWLDASWRAAEREGISSEEFCHWIEVGVWNLAGDPSVVERIGVFRRIAGAQGWLLAQANMTPEDALDQFYRHGPVAVLEAAQVITALSDMGGSLPAEDRVEPSSLQPQHSLGTAAREPLDFS